MSLINTPDMTENTPIPQEEANKQVAEILSNPDNESKFPDIFAKAKEIGYFDTKGNVKSDPILDTIKSNFGDYTSVDEFIDVAKKWKTDAETNLNAFSNLPEPLFKALNAAVRGEDWRAPILTTPLIDFSKSYTDDELLGAYSSTMSVKFTQDELADPDNIAVKRAKQQVQQAFQLDKQSNQNAKLLADQRRQQLERHAKDTLEETISEFKKVNPKATEVQINRLRNDLSNLRFQDKFLDGKGGFNKDAAKNYFPIVFAEDYAKIVSGVVVDNSNKTAEELLSANQERQLRDFSRKGGEMPNAQDQVRKSIGESFNSKKDPFKLTPTQA